MTEHGFWLPATPVKNQTSTGAGQAQNQTSFVTVVGAPGTDSFVFGTELWAVSQLELSPTHSFSIETATVRQEADRLRSLIDGTVDFALVRNEVPTSFARHLRAVMVLWPNGVDEIGAEATRLLTHADVPVDIVYRVTSTIFEHAAKLGGARATMGLGSPRAAMVSLNLPIHPGAHQYYEDQGLGFGQVTKVMSRRPQSTPQYDAVDKVRLRADEALQFAVACRDAANRGALNRVEGDALAEICGAEYIDGALGEPVNLSNGQGGPKVSVREPDDVSRQPMVFRGDKSTMLPARQPTM